MNSAEPSAADQESVVYAVKDGFLATFIAVFLNLVVTVVTLPIARFLFETSNGSLGVLVAGIFVTGIACFSVTLNFAILFRIILGRPAIVVTTSRVRVWRGFHYRNIPIAMFRGAGTQTSRAGRILRIYFATDQPSRSRVGEDYPGFTVGTATFKEKASVIVAKLNGARRSIWQEG